MKCHSVIYDLIFQGMKPPVLKNLYCLLVRLSTEAQWSFKFAVGSHDFDLEMCHDGIKVAFGDICELSNVLFKELEERFEQCFSSLCDLSANKDIRECSSNLGLYDTVEVVKLLLRCCMILLNLLAGKLSLVLEKRQILLNILRKLSMPKLVEKTGQREIVFEKSVFHKCPLGDNGGNASSSAEKITASLHFLEPYNPLLFFLSKMLEIFVDELLVHEQLRRYFTNINSVASINDRLFDPHSSQDDVMMESICNHFIHTFSDKQAFGDFLRRLFRSHHKELGYHFREPVLGVTSAVSLLLSPIMISAPKYMQAHVLSLVSEAIENVMNIKGSKPDHKLITCFLSTFEKSVILYMTNMSYGYSTSRGFATYSTSHEISPPSLEFYISADTKNKVDSLIDELDCSPNLLNDNFPRMKSDLVSSSMRFVKEFQNVCDISCQDEILAILSCTILKASENFDDAAINPLEGTAVQHIYFLASLLKLMSISLLQVVWFLRHGDDSCSLKTLKDLSSCKEYEFILGLITCFRDMDISLPLQEVLSNEMSRNSTKHTDSKSMFLHFSGLMSLSFVGGHDCLVKGCLLTILALLNLFVFEEGNLDALKSLVNSNTESFLSRSPVVKFQETVVGQNSGLVVASKFQKIRSLYKSVIENKNNEMKTLSSQMEPVVAFEEETEETSNGEIFFNCITKMGQNPSNFDDLVGFVECNEEKDFSDWLNKRKKFRKRKLEKMAVLRWERKKKSWRTLKGRRN
ncbi:hypothetical protein ACJIZ3_003046 [Penstemon smallii]|uniref:DUF7812 domain-containing protein n=1 Tax=Penstemon smallii TaxID=265156 RepID=A0ABD3UBW6_9LAMI